MALSNEDKKDVKDHLGKALANKVSRVTRDDLKKKIHNTNPAALDARMSGYKNNDFSGKAKSKALSKKMDPLDKESKKIYRKDKAGARQGNWMKVMPGDR